MRTKKLEEQADDPVGAARRWLFHGLNAKIGVIGTTLLIGIIVLVMHWDEFLTIPLVTWMSERLAQLKPLPVASGQRFTVGVALLENDRDGVHRRILREALSRMDGVELIMVDRLITLDGATKPQVAQLAGRAEARQILGETRADVLIWGAALDSGANSPMSLHWTASTSVELSYSSHPYLPERDFDLPPMFWKDLREVFGLLISTRLGELQQRQGAFIAEEAEPFVHRIRALLHAANPTLTRAPLQIALADALMIYGQQRADLSLYEEAAEYYRRALKDTSRETMPLKWASLTNQLGDALQALGELAHSETKLEEARAAFLEAAGDHLHELDPLSWAVVQNNLGTVLDALGEYKQDRTLLDSAIAARREALAVVSRERAPDIWAILQFNLGQSLYVLGSLLQDKALLQQSIDASRRSLEVVSRERKPLDWAAAQSTVASALAALGTLTKNAALLWQATATFGLVLEEITPERAPQIWALIQNNLAGAQASLYQRTGNPQWLEYAVGTYRSALTIYRREHDLRTWARGQYELVRALITLAERTHSMAKLQEGYSAYVEWLKAVEPDKTPDTLQKVCAESEAAVLSSIVSASAAASSYSAPVPSRWKLQ